jgi:hypothetical protein
LYQKPYNHRFDIVPYLPATMIPDFSKFFGEDVKSKHEHVSQFLARLEESTHREAYCVRLFSMSLTGTAFAWYATLPPNSIITLGQLEQKFYEHFFLYRGTENRINDYISRFRDTNRCF